MDNSLKMVIHSIYFNVIPIAPIHHNSDLKVTFIYYPTAPERNPNNQTANHLVTVGRKTPFNRKKLVAEPGSCEGKEKSADGPRDE